MSPLAGIEELLRGARPQALGTLVRHFRDLDVAEEALEEARLRALRRWPAHGPPRDPAAWLVFVGKNAALDGPRRTRQTHGDESSSAVSASDADQADPSDCAPGREDILRLLFMCCQSELPATYQIALALRLVCGMSVEQIALAFLVNRTVMEQRLSRAKQYATEPAVPVAPSDPHGTAERLDAVATVIYLMFNAGYSATGSAARDQVRLCDEAIWLSRLLLPLYPNEPELMGLTALLLLQHSRTPARLDREGAVVLMEDQDRTLWDRQMIENGVALLDKAALHGRPGPYQTQAAIASIHSRANRRENTDWARIDVLYAELERLQPSPVVTLNRAVAVSEARGAEEALHMIEPLAARLSGYFYFFGVKGSFLLRLGRADEARVAFNRAIALAKTPAEAAHIRSHLDRLREGASPLRSLPSVTPNRGPEDDH